MNCASLRVGCAVAAIVAALTCVSQADAQEPVKVGILGMDNYQCVAFTQLWHSDKAEGDLTGIRVVAAYPGEPSPRIKDSAANTQRWIEQTKRHNLKLVNSTAELLELVDAVLVGSIDGSTHLEALKPVLAARKPVFVIRPLAASLEDAIRIFDLAKKHDCPIFSCSQHRFSPGFFDMRQHPEIGAVLGCDVYGGYPPEQPRDDVIWGALHGVETMYTIMQPKVVSVTRTSTDNAEVLACVCEDGRIGTWRGLRSGFIKYSAIVFGEKGIGPAGFYGYAAPVGGVTPKTRYMGYEGVATQIAKFYKTKQSPVAPEETLEIFAVLEAAEHSKKQGGVPILVADILKAAREKVAAAP